MPEQRHGHDVHGMLATATTGGEDYEATPRLNPARATRLRALRLTLGVVAGDVDRGAAGRGGRRPRRGRSCPRRTPRRGRLGVLLARSCGQKRSKDVVKLPQPNARTTERLDGGELLRRRP